MAVSSGAFSIREYVANMRTIDVSKSWPFDGTPELPQMEVKKFCFWRDELEKLKARGKGPKKRSIADIFAVAAHVEREDVNADYLDDEGEESDGDDPRVLALCDDKIKEKVLAKKSKLSLSKKKGSDCSDQKEKPQAANFDRIPRSPLLQGSEENAFNVVPILKKKVSEENASNVVPTPKKKRSKLKCLARQMQQKSVQTSKLKRRTKSDLTGGNILKSCTKEVTEKDSILCYKQLSILESDQQNISSDIGGAIRDKDHLVEGGENIAADKIIDRDQNHQYDSEVHLAGGKKKIDAFCHPEMQNLLKPDIGFERDLSNRLMAENLVVPSGEDPPSYASLSRLSHFRNVDDNRDSNIDDMSRATTMSSREFIDMIPLPSSSFLATHIEAQGRFPPSRNGKAVNYDFSGEVLRNIVPFSDFKQGEIPCDVRYTDQGYCGLPLNSQGELIQFRSNGSGKGMLNPSMKPTNAAPGSSMVDLSHFKHNIYDGSKEIDLFKSPPIQNFVEESSRFSLFHEVPSNSHIYNLQSTLEKRHPSKLLHNHNENWKRFNHASQQTMRLMGKEFMIGKSNDDSQSSDGGNIWTDKQIIAEHQIASSSGIDASSSKTQQFEHGLNTILDNKNQIHQLSQGYVEVDVNGSRIPYPLLTEIYPHFNIFMSSNRSSQLHPYFLSTPSISIEKSPLQEPFVYRCGYDFTPQDDMGPNFSDTQKQHTLPCPYRPSLEFTFLNPVYGDNVDSSSLPPTVSGPSFRPISSYVPNPVSSLSNRQGSTFALSHPLTPPNSGFIPASAVNNIHGSRMIPNVSVEDFDKGKATRKKRADILNESIRRSKIPNMVSPELNLTRERVCNKDGVLEFGPGKQVVEPGSSVIEDHSRSAQWKVPLAATTTSGLISNLQRKLTPIFRF